MHMLGLFTMVVSKIATGYGILPKGMFFDCPEDGITLVLNMSTIPSPRIESPLGFVIYLISA